MKLIWLYGIGVLSLLSGAPAAADVVTDFKECLKKHNNVSNEGSPCGRIFQRANDALASALTQARADIQGSNVSVISAMSDLFEREQAMWDQYNQAACRVYADRDLFGTIGRDILTPECKISVTHARTLQLRAFSKNF